MKKNVDVELRHAEAAAGGATDPESGEYVPPAGGGEAAPYWTGRAFFLDEGAVLEQDARTGAPQITSDGQLFLPKKTVERAGVRDRDAVRMTYANGDAKDASILRAQRATDICYLKDA